MIMNKKRIPSGSSKGGQFAPDTRGKNPPKNISTKNNEKIIGTDSVDDYNEEMWKKYTTTQQKAPLIKLSRIAASGNRGANGFLDGQIVCSDGYSFSVIAGEGTYCIPRSSALDNEPYSGPYTHLEVGFPSKRPEPWAVWSSYAENPKSPTDTVYPRVPLAMIENLIKNHSQGS
jgi:hypothetical protein